MTVGQEILKMKQLYVYELDKGRGMEHIMR